MRSDRDPHNNEERRADQQPGGDDQVRGLGVELQHLLEEEQRVELAAVPDNRLAGSRTEQREDHELEVRPGAKGFSQRRLGQACPGS